MDIGQNIKYLRELKGLSQFDMAEKMGITRKTYINIESKGNKITLDYVHSVAEILGVGVKDIYELDDKVVINGRSIGSKSGKANLAFSNASALQNTHKMYRELLSTKDELIAAMRQDLERLKRSDKV